MNKKLLIIPVLFTFAISIGNNSSNTNSKSNPFSNDNWYRVNNNINNNNSNDNKAVLASNSNIDAGCLDELKNCGGYLHIHGWVYNKYHAVSGSKRYILMEYPSEAYGIMVMYEGESAVQQLNAKRFSADRPLKSGTYNVVVDVDNGGWTRWIDTTITITKPTATFNKAGGTGGSATATVDYNTSNPTISVPTKTGYTFNGYYTGQNGTGTKYWNANGTSASKWLLTGSQTVYAYWTPNSYNITYKDGGGTSGSTFSGTHESGYPTTHTYGTATTLKSATKTGYTFGGWYKEAACTNKVTSLGATAYTGAVTLYAKWTPNTYNITYKDGGGTSGSTFSGTHESGYPTTHTYGTATTLKSATKTGYTFGGWYKEAACTNKVTSLGATAYTGAVTLYAKWTPNNYSITYLDKGGGSFSGTHESGYPTSHTYGTTTTLKSATKTHHIFEGWYKEKDCSGSKVTSLGASEYTSNITLYAKWKLDSSNPTITSTGGFYKSEDNKKQIVMFGVTFSDYAKLNSGDTCGIYVYSDEGSSLTASFSTTNISAVKEKEGRFYCVYGENESIVENATYYAKGYVIVNGTTIYSSLLSAKGNYDKEFNL